MPDEEVLTQMGQFNEELVKAGILLAMEGLHPSAKGVRVKFPGGTVIDGPFAETKELIGGFWIIEVKDKEEALAWARRIPFEEGEVEIRRVSEPEDFKYDEVSAPALDMEKEFHSKQKPLKG
jgi:hypothetical protein